MSLFEFFLFFLSLTIKTTIQIISINGIASKNINFLLITSIRVGVGVGLGGVGGGTQYIG